MKKVVLSIAFVAAVLVSCNKKAEGEATADSTATPVDSAIVATDSANVATDSATVAPADSAKVATEAPAKEEVKK
jgi:PBP1b-binding outer membrane lipoprotein LpoB